MLFLGLRRAGSVLPCSFLLGVRPLWSLPCSKLFADALFGVYAPWYVHGRVWKICVTAEKSQRKRTVYTPIEISLTLRIARATERAGVQHVLVVDQVCRVFEDLTVLGTCLARSSALVRANRNLFSITIMRCYWSRCVHVLAACMCWVADVFFHYWREFPEKQFCVLDAALLTTTAEVTREDAYIEHDSGLVLLFGVVAS